MDDSVTPTVDEYRDLLYFYCLVMFNIEPDKVDKVGMLQMQRFIVWYRHYMEKQTEGFNISGMDRLV